MTETSSRRLDPLSRAMGVIDALSEYIGRATAWLALLMVVIGAFNAIARYLGRFVGVSLSSNVYLELQWYLFSLIFLLGGAYALRHDAHIRVDVLFSRLSLKAQAWINIAGTVLLLLPFSIFALWVTYPVVGASWRVREGSPDPGGLPRYPLKAMVLVCFGLLILQALVELVKEFRKLRGEGSAADDSGIPAEGV